MATMIPDDIESFNSEGEAAFFRFLRSSARPDSRNVCWYLPKIDEQEPDFVLYSADAGLIVFEVKDWALDQIVEADPQNFLLKLGRKTQRRKNPLQQARDYVQSLKSVIKKDGVLVSQDPLHHGNPKIPIDYAVVFPNINKFEYTRKGLDQVIECGKIFFWDDLHPESEICADPSGRTFLDALKDKFHLRFPFHITGKELDHLRRLIFPTVRIELPPRDPGDQFARDIKRLKLLDHHQEAIARKYDGGHRILLGPSGSGKTLILAHKAAFLKQYNPAIRSLLFVCYNITLVNYIKRLLSDKKVSLGEEGVEVLHFFQLCSKILREEVAHEREDPEYYDLVVQETLDRLKGSRKKYDAILVDEGQDFSDDMYKVVVSLLNGETNNLTIALDDNQDIYRRSRSWKQTGIESRGRVHRITRVYRNTAEISDLASKFMGDHDDRATDEKTPQLELFPDPDMFHGPEPEIRRFQTMEEIVAYVVDGIQKLTDSRECPFSEIAIIYTKRAPDHAPDKHIPRMFGRALESKGILHNWAAEDYRSKSSYDVTTNSVTLSTIHSTKGLDYHCVFLVGLDLVDPGRLSAEQITSLAYVGLTRARHRLYIPFLKRNDLIDKLLNYLA